MGQGKEGEKSSHSMGILTGGACPPTPGPRGPQVAVVVQIMGSFPPSQAHTSPKGHHIASNTPGSQDGVGYTARKQKAAGYSLSLSPALGKILTWRGWEGVFICEVGAGLKTTGAV